MAHDAASGHIDSVARRLLQPNSDRALPLGAFGSRLNCSTIVARRAVFEHRPVTGERRIRPVAGSIRCTRRYGNRTGSRARHGFSRPADDRTARRPHDGLSVRAKRRHTRTGECHLGRYGRSTNPDIPRVDDTLAAPESSALPLASPQAVEAINHWADSVTHGKIATIIDQPLPDTARLFIASANCSRPNGSTRSKNQRHGRGNSPSRRESGSPCRV